MSKFIFAAILSAVLVLGCSKPVDDPKAVDFALPDVNNKVVRLSEYRGQWIVVNFWATWCGPCLREIPELIRFHEENNAKNAMVIGVNFEEIDEGLLAEFIQHKGITYPIVRAGTAPILPFEPLKGLPTTFLVDPAGHLIKRHVGPLTKKQLTKMIYNTQQGAAY